MSELPGFSMVAAIDRDRGLGKDGDLPWYIPADLRHFARTTTDTKDPARQNAVIMGRVTCETIPARYWPLKDRTNVVITRNPAWHKDGATVESRIEEALEHLRGKVERIFVVGGGQIYSMAIELDACHELILTRIDGSFDCDAFFPAYESRFHCAEELARGEHDGLGYVIERWVRNAS